MKNNKIIKPEDNLVKEVKRIGKYLEIKVIITMFGKDLFKWIWPPKNEEEKTETINKKTNNLNSKSNEFEQIGEN